jgi:hypothetical protein
MEEGQYHQLWLTLYIPKKEAVTLLVELCDDCIEPALAEARQNSRPLADREAKWGSGTGAPVPDPWAAFH